MKSLLFFSAWQSRGISKRNIHRIHTTTCECVPQSLCDMLHCSNIWILSHFPPLLHRVVHRLQRVGKECTPRLGGANAMKSKGHTRPPSSLEATRWYIKFRSDHQPNIEKMISHNTNKLKQHVRHVPAQPVRFHVCLFQFLTVQYKQCLAARACKVSQKLFCFGGRSHGSLSP